MKHFLLAVLAAIALATASSPAEAGSYTVYVDDHAGFDSALAADLAATVVDTSGAFAADPSAATGLASVIRTGTLAGQGFTYTAYDVNFTTAASPPGTLTPGSVGGDLLAATAVDVERPAAQGAATGTGSWGLDSGSGSTTSRNGLLVDFTTTPGNLGIGHFALELVDFEAGAAGTPGLLRLYDGGMLVFSHAFTFAGPKAGNDELHFLGVVAGAGAAWFDQIVVVVGDDTPGGTGNSETWAADRFQFGVTTTPEPGTWALFGVGVAGIAVIVRRRKAARACGAGPCAQSPTGDAAP